MLLRKCPNNHYSISEICPECKKPTKSAHPAKMPMK
ncbi:MAG: hypothetical protein HZB65_04845 [Candidatus Aenigmarchaeota archaeon]|nr:hypothetical protein [Candidatus Aenigmarchaeota archaeon]